MATPPKSFWDQASDLLYEKLDDLILGDTPKTIIEKKGFGPPPTITPTSLLHEPIKVYKHDTWVPNPEHLKMKASLGMAKISHEYDPTQHEHLVNLRVPMCILPQKQDASKFVVQMKQAFEKAETPSDLFASMALILNEFEEAYFGATSGPEEDDDETITFKYTDEDEIPF